MKPNYSAASGSNEFERWKRYWPASDGSGCYCYDFYGAT